MRLDDLLLNEEDDTLPEALLERSAAFMAEKDAVPKLLDSIQRMFCCCWFCIL